MFRIIIHSIQKTGRSIREVTLCGFCLALLLAGGCVPEESSPINIEYQKRLVKKFYSISLQDTIPYRCDYCVYDEQNRLFKIFPYIENISDTSDNSGYHLFVYNSENRLRKEISYFWNGINPSMEVRDSISYFYEGKHLNKEMYYVNNFGLMYVITYYYSDNLLASKKLTKGQSSTWYFYTYQDSLRICETQSTDSLGSYIESYTTYTYYKGLKTKSEYYHRNHRNEDQLGIITNYSYNSERQLVLEESLVNPEWVSPGPYVYRYEYERIPE